MSGYQLGRGVIGPILAASAALASAASTLAHDKVSTGEPVMVAATRAADELPPLWDNLGGLGYRITTSDPRAQRYFDQGLRLAYAFNHAEALRSFRAAQTIDPGCALCFWGEALVLGPNINAPMASEAVAPALAAVAKARALAGRTSARERALIAAVARRYAAGGDRSSLDAAYADAMGAAAARFPEDSQIAVLHAEALMNLTPWAYWEADATTPKGPSAEILRILERVLAKTPEHPAAIHLYIHMVEASTTPERAEPHADRLARLMPGAGHLVHMPSHIYVRVGRYRDSAEANRAAVAADEAYFAEVEPDGIYPFGYFPHNVHFVLISEQMLGDRRRALATADKLERVVVDEVAREIAWVQVIKAAPYFALAQLGTPGAMLAQPDPGDGFPYVQAMWRYMRAVAFIALRRHDAARAEAAAIAGIGRATDFVDMTSGGVPAPDLLRLARHVIAGRLAQAERKLEVAAAEFERAIAIEDALPYMEPAYWYYPVRQSLGAVLLAAGQPSRAETVFRESLLRVPNNPWALYGLRQAYEALGNGSAAAEIGLLLDAAWAGPDELLDLARL